MKRNYFHPLLSLLFLLLFTCLNGCGPEIPDQMETIDAAPQCPSPQTDTPAVKQLPLADPEIAADTKVLRVGIFLNAPPFIFEKDCKIMGLEADLANQLGVYTNKSVQFVKVPEPLATEALLKNHVDILMTGRKIIRNFSSPVTFSEPYLRSGQILLVRTHEAPLFSSGIYNLENSGYTFGVLPNSAGDQFLTKNIRGIRILRFKSVNGAIKALNSKKIDLFLHDAPTICSYAFANKTANLTPILSLVTEEYIGWEMRRDDEELRQQANTFIRQRKADGLLQKTIKQWIPNL